MTTIDASGRVSSRFCPPTGADGMPMSSREWRINRSLQRLAGGEDMFKIERELASELGESIVWHGWGPNSEQHANAIREAIAEVRKAAGFGNPPVQR